VIRFILVISILVLSSCKVSYQETNAVANGGAAGTGYIGVYFNAKVCLEGSYLGTTSLLNPKYSDPTKPLLPLISPFSLTPEQDVPIENYASLGASGANEWVDWVQVEVFSKVGSEYVIVDSQSALLKKDGVLYNNLGYQGLFFSSIPEGEYYINIITRNHLGVGANDPVTLSSTLNASFDIDFTEPGTTYLGEPTETPSVDKGGLKCIAAGDLNGDNLINDDDLDNLANFILNLVSGHPDNIKVLGYHLQDLDFNGEVQEYTDDPGSEAGSANDRKLIKDNNSKSSQIYFQNL
jgi:hypothetical protein